MRRARPSGSDSPFRRLLLAALQSSGISLAEACRRSGVEYSTVKKWMKANSVPRRNNVERLAAVLECPELVNEIVTDDGIGRDGKARFITMTCTQCATVQKWAAGTLRSRIRRGQFAEGEHD